MDDEAICPLLDEAKEFWSFKGFLVVLRVGDVADLVVVRGLEKSRAFNNYKRAGRELA